MPAIHGLREFGPDADEGSDRGLHNEAFCLRPVGKAAADASFDRLQAAIEAIGRPPKRELEIMLNETKSFIDADEGLARRVALALSSGYQFICCVDADSGRYEEFAAPCGQGRLEKVSGGEDAFAELGRRIDACVLPEDRMRVALSLERDSLLARLRERSPFIMTYRRMVGAGFRYYMLKAALVEDEQGCCLVVGAADVDERLREPEGSATELMGDMDFSIMARTLMSDYVALYCVDLETDRFVEYSAEEDYRRMGIQSRGEDFFELSLRNAGDVLDPEDLPRFMASFKKENLMKELSDDGFYTFNYRLMLGGVSTYVNMKAIRIGDADSRYVVIGVSNVDAQTRRELAQASALSAAREEAFRDMLTGIRNKNAYTAEEARWNERIARGEVTELAVAVCDLNKLKLINDTEGHKAGDQYLQDATRAICETFRHSPVFRIGGDEFVAILIGTDFRNREELVARFLRENKERSDADDGGVVIACGCSDLLPEDLKLEDAFNRADAAMYENKKSLKGARL